MTIDNRLADAAQHVLTLACDAFSAATQRYRARPRARAPARADQVDAWVRFTIGGKKFDMPTLVKAGAGEHGASAVLSRMHAGAAERSGRPLMLVAQHVSPKLAEQLIAQRIPFLDTAGNAYLDEPEATIMIVGRDRPALARIDTTSRSTTPKGLRVGFALLTQPELVDAPYRTIAERSAVALNTVNLAMDDLMSRGLVVAKATSGTNGTNGTSGTRGTSGTSGKRRIVADRRRFIEDWVSLYPTRLRPKLNPRRFVSSATAQDWWTGAGSNGAEVLAGGEVAADLLCHQTRPATVTLYSRAGLTTRLMSAGMLRPDERGDVEVLDTFWPADVESRWNLPVANVVHPLLVYADLLSSADDRNRAVAQTIYDQYLAHEAD